MTFAPCVSSMSPAHFVWDGTSTTTPDDSARFYQSLDWAEPPQSWRWAGPEWTGQAPAHTAGGVSGLTIEVTDPLAAAQRWAAVLGVSAIASGDSAVVELAACGQLLRFDPARPGHGEGITAVSIAGLRNGPRLVGGVRFDCEEQ